MVDLDKDTWRLFTPDEASRVAATLTIDQTTNVMLVEEPARLHTRTVERNQWVYGHTLLEAVDLGDGYIRAAYALNFRLPPRKGA